MANWKLILRTRKNPIARMARAENKLKQPSGMLKLSLLVTAMEPSNPRSLQAAKAPWSGSGSSDYRCVCPLGPLQRYPGSSQRDVRPGCISGHYQPGNGQNPAVDPGVAESATGAYLPFVWLDAIHYKVRHEGRVMNRTVCCMIGLTRKDLNN